MLISTTLKHVTFVRNRFSNEKSRQKVRDHDHLTGKFRGAAHSSCNLLVRKSYKIPVFFHNFRGYDSHLLVHALSNYQDREVNVIGQGLEKYLSLSWGKYLIFKDSLQFLNTSLQSLVKNLYKSGAENFIHLKK